jgi:hypothetical protein
MVRSLITFLMICPLFTSGWDMSLMPLLLFVRQRHGGLGSASRSRLGFDRLLSARLGWML